MLWSSTGRHNAYIGPVALVYYNIISGNMGIMCTYTIQRNGRVKRFLPRPSFFVGGAASGAANTRTRHARTSPEEYVVRNSLETRAIYRWLVRVYRRGIPTLPGTHTAVRAQFGWRGGYTRPYTIIQYRVIRIGTYTGITISPSPQNASGDGYGAYGFVLVLMSLSCSRIFPMRRRRVLSRCDIPRWYIASVNVV